MSRFLILLALAMIAYFSLRSRFHPLKRPAARPEAPPPDPRFHDEGDMVQDPVCGTYVDTASALFLTHQDNQFWFCSEACRDKFLTEIKKK